MLFMGDPVSDLAGRIETCCCVTGSEDGKRAFYEVLPDSGAHLIFRISSGGCRLVLMGQATEKCTIEIDGASDYLYIRFRPGEAPRLADIHPAELIDAHADLPTLGGMRIDSLADRLLSLPDPGARLQTLASLVRGTAPLIYDARCRRAISLIDSHAGQLHVSELATGMGMSTRGLERLFAAGLGLSPKRLARLVRLKHLADHLRSGSSGNLADLACLYGYTDQSHMIRDFKSLTGRLPGQRAAGEMCRLEGGPETRVVHHYQP